MTRRLPNTPRSRVRAAVRQLWLRSRERAAALKRAKYTCAHCGKKQSRAKGREVFVEVHHKAGRIDWEKVIDIIAQLVLQTPDDYDVLCTDCHKRITEESHASDTSI